MFIILKPSNSKKKCANSLTLYFSKGANPPRPLKIYHLSVREAVESQCEAGVHPPEQTGH